MAADKLDTVRKLLAKAERAATEQEAQAYTAKAVELMARHGIDVALLAARTPGHDPIDGSRIVVHDPYSAGKARMLGWVASALGCRCVLHGVRGGRVESVTVFGHASDRERVELLHTSLLLQATTQLVRLRPPQPGESVAAYRRSWLHGFAVEVHRRLSTAEADAAAEATAAERLAGPAAERLAGPAAERLAGPAAERAAAPSVALVLADRRERVERAYAAAFPALGAARRATLSGSGYGDGTRAGARADLGRGTVGRSRSRALPA